MSIKWKTLDIEWQKTNVEIVADLEDDHGLKVTQQAVASARHRLAPATIRRETDPLEEFLAITPQERRKFLSQFINDAAKNLTQAANVFTCMTAAGDDVEWVPANIRTMLGRVAAKTMLPEVFLNLSGRLRSRAMILPVKEQERILSGEKFPVVRSEDDTTDFIYIAAADMNSKQIDQVFAESGVRSKKQQAAWIAGQESKKTRGPLKARFEKLDDGSLLIKSTGVITTKDLKKLLKS